MAEPLPGHHHEDWHTPKGRAIREIIFGMNDGLVTTIGFLAGVTSSISEIRYILLAGMAEVVAGAVSMGIGAYLATKSQQEFFDSEIEQEKWEIEKMPEKEAEEIRDIYGKMGFTPSEQDMIVNRVTSDKELLLRFMKREELGLIDEHRDDRVQVELTMGGSFFFASLPPSINWRKVKRVMGQTRWVRALFFSSLHPPMFSLYRPIGKKLFYSPLASR